MAKLTSTIYKEKVSSREKLSAQDLVALTLIFVVTLIQFMAFGSGFLSPDSLDQYRQALEGRFNDAHPIAMSLIWSLLLPLFPGSLGILILQLLIYGLASWVTYRHFRAKRWSLLFTVVGLSPVVLNFAGVIWKDVLLAAILLLASSLLLGRRSVFKGALVGLLLLSALFIRHNAFFAVIPLAALAIKLYWPRIRSPLAFALSTIFCLGLQFGGNAAMSELLNVEKSNASNYVMVDDLAHLSQIRHESLLPNVTLAQLELCDSYQLGQQKLVAKVFCLSQLEDSPLPSVMKEPLTKTWLAGVLANPVEYFKFRLAAYGYFLRSDDSGPYYIWQAGSDANPEGIGSGENSFSQLLRTFVFGAAALLPILFRPGFWLSLGVFLLLLTFFTKGANNNIRYSRYLFISAVVYLLGWAPVTIAADFRYAYWPIIAITFGAIALVANRRQLQLKPRSKSKLILPAVVLIATIGLIRISVSLPLHNESVSLVATKSANSFTLALQNDVVSAKSGFKAQGADPYLVFHQDEDLNFSNADFLAFEFDCKGSSAPQLLQFFAADASTSEFSESRSQSLYVFPGMNKIPIALQASQLDIGEQPVRYLRMDIVDPTPCETFEVTNVSLLGK